MNDKKVLIVTALTGFIRAFLLHDIEILQDMGYTVYCAANGKGDNETIAQNDMYFHKRGVVFHHIDFSSRKPISKSTVSAYLQVKRLIDEQEFDIIHVHTPIPGVIVRMASKRTRRNGTKVIYTTHGFYFHRGSSWKEKMVYYNIEKMMSRFTDMIVTINREDFVAAQSMHCRHVTRINGVGVDTNRYQLENFDRKSYRASLGVSGDEVILLSIGELSNRKNYQVVIKALADLKDYNIKYIICGKGLVGSGTQSELQELSTNLSVDVTFLGYRTDIPQIVGCADIGVIPSRREGLGLAGIEMLAGGIPVIGSDVQGIKDYIVDGVNGFLVNPYSEQEFSTAIRNLLDVEIRKKMSHQCVCMAKQFDCEVSYQQMREIYQMTEQMNKEHF